MVRYCFDYVDQQEREKEEGGKTKILIIITRPFSGSGVTLGSVLSAIMFYYISVTNLPMLLVTASSWVYLDGATGMQ